jgi:hypothetical protein
VTDQTPEIEFSEQDEKDLSTLLGEAAEAKYNPVLRIWKEILSEDNISHGARITIPWANGICGKYANMTYALMPAFVERYFQIMNDLAADLNEEIASDDDCLNWHSIDEDKEENGGHYRALLTTWQKRILTWEMGWDCAHPDAAAHVAALGEISAFFFGDNGLTGHLGAIGFEFTDADQEALANALSELQEQLLEGAESE